LAKDSASLIQKWTPRGKFAQPVLYRIAGMENIDGKELLKFEMHRAGAVTNTDLLSVDEHGIICVARMNLDGELIKLDPPQTMIATPLKPGTSWNFNGQVGEMKVHQHYDVTEKKMSKCPRENFTHPYSRRTDVTQPDDD